jgi:hypothetical protein
MSEATLMIGHEPVYFAEFDEDNLWGAMYPSVELAEDDEELDFD